jgi:hypothetical protein
MQASLLKSRTRWWSRPLVALLYFLQPIVRGWERHQSRLALRLAPEAARETLDSVTMRDGTDSLDEARYWSEQRIERVEFVSNLLRELDKRGWPNRSDIGWSEFDVEIYGNRWSNVQLITAAEDHPRGRQLIRCRLRATWSLQAKVVFWSLLGLEAIVVGSFGGWLNWIAMVLLTLPLFAYFQHCQKRKLQSLLVAFLDELAKGLKLIKVSADQNITPPAATPKPPPMRVELVKPANSES